MAKNKRKVKSKTKRYEIFSSRSNPISGDSTIWRYLNIDAFLWLMEYSALYHARLDRFKDGYEGSVTKQYAKKRDAGETHGISSLPSLEPMILKCLRVRSFATCWRKSETESPEMWKIYTKDDQGVAIVTTVARLSEASDTSSVAHATLGPVEYLDFDEDDMSLPMGLRARPGMAKQLKYKFENEVRGIVTKDALNVSSALDCEKLCTEMPTGVCVPVSLRQLLIKIVPSPTSSQIVKDLVRKAAKRRKVSDRVESSSFSESSDPIF